MLSLLFIAFLSPSGSDAAAVERALASVQPTSICADVRFIACDELEGRDTPSPGLRLAARYIKARLERLGLQPMGDNGFFDEYELVTTGLDPEKSGLTVERGKDNERTVLRYGRDCFVFGSGVSDL